MKTFNNLVDILFFLANIESEVAPTKQQQETN